MTALKSPIFNTGTEKLPQLSNVLAWSRELGGAALPGARGWIPVIQLLLHWIANQPENKHVFLEKSSS